MNFKRFWPLLLAFFGMVAIPLLGDDLPAGSFSSKCSYSSDTNIGGVETIRNVYISGNKMRVETTVNGVQSILVIDGDQQVTYAVIPAQRTIVTMPMSNSVMQNALTPSHPTGTVTKLGQDNLNGIACTKYSVTTQGGKTFYLWYDSTDHPIKFAAQDNSTTTTFMNYQEGPQQDSLFQPPAGYKQVDAPKRVPRPANLPPLPQSN